MAMAPVNAQKGTPVAALPVPSIGSITSVVDEPLGGDTVPIDPMVDQVDQVTLGSVGWRLPSAS